jgi:Gluconate 2-dehydrogenase subunit 3
MKRWSRRKFMKAGIVASIAVNSGTAAELSTVLGEKRLKNLRSTKVELESGERELLRTAMDEIIPAGDGMPAASEVGGVDYLDQLAGSDKKTAKDLRKGLSELDRLGNERYKATFVSLLHEQRVELLTSLEKGNPSVFKVLRDYVYEAYYVQPRVQILVGYDGHPTNKAGPHLQPFDEAILAEVRKKPKFYREV